MTDRENEFQRAYTAALRLLGMCDRSRRDLKERLSKKEFSTDVVEIVLGQLESMGLIDDERYALKFAMDAVKRKNAGPEAIKYGLQRKGIDCRVVEETVAKVFQDVDEKTVARRALGKKLEVRNKKLEGRSKKTETRRDEIKRLSDYLRRKGFSYDIIRETLKEMEKNEDDI